MSLLMRKSPVSAARIGDQADVLGSPWQVCDPRLTDAHAEDCLAERACQRATVLDQTTLPLATYQQLANPRTFDVYRYDVPDRNSLGLRRTFRHNGGVNCFSKH